VAANDPRFGSTLPEAPMNRSLTTRSIKALAVLGFLLGTAAFADDTMSRHQMMKECIERQKTKDVAMSKSEMKRYCKDELKRQKATGAMPEQPPTDTPPEPRP
jgi:pentapeptide MXKDX repeat protein